MTFRHGQKCHMARSPKMVCVYQILEPQCEKNGSGPQFLVPRWFRPTTASVDLVGYLGCIGRSPSSQNSLLQLHKTTGASAVDQRRGRQGGQGGRPGERKISRNRDFSIFLKLITGLRGVIRGTQGIRAASETHFKCPVYATMASGTAWTNIAIYNLKQLNQKSLLRAWGPRRTRWASRTRSCPTPASGADQSVSRPRDGLPRPERESKLLLHQSIEWQGQE